MNKPTCPQICEETGQRKREREREREREEGALGPGGHVDSVERAFRSDRTRLRMEGLARLPRAIIITNLRGCVKRHISHIR